FGTPPAKQGDYAYLLHIVRSLKSMGKGACILPHGVLFRGNAEADIRKNLIRKGYIKGIIGLPANLFYGTGIPACIIVIDKENAHTRKAIFMIDASSGYLKDGNKNRLRDCDLHQIVDVFNKRLEIPKCSRMVSIAEIERNDFNLNIPRYIDSQQAEDIQDIEGHLKGGIPMADVDALQPYWDVCPQLRQTLFKANRPGYLDLAVAKQAIKPTIYGHPEFVAFIECMKALFADWRERSTATLKGLQANCHPKIVIAELAEDLLAHYAEKPLIAKYDVYQHLLDYWAATMQDDCYLIAADGWKAETYRIIETNKKGKEVDKGWACDLAPKPLIVDRYFAPQQTAIREQEAMLESVTVRMTELEEEQGGEEGAFSELEKVNKANVTARLKELQAEQNGADKARAMSVLSFPQMSDSSFPRRRESSSLPKAAEALAPYGDEGVSEIQILLLWLSLNTEEADLKKRLKEAEAALDALAYAQYPTLTETEIKTLVVDDKWMTAIAAAIHGEMDRISQALTQRVKELAERYETPLPQAALKVAELEAKVNRHLAKMGFCP
ncbi:MAG: N-6 DNA methylase, partial [Candidatus Paceibacterota bacterium]